MSPTDAPVVDEEAVRFSYPAVRERIRSFMAESIPSGSTVAVVSKGDEELTRVEGLECWHVPRGEGGAFAGHYPADGDAAASHVEALIDAGADFLLIPSTYSWWLREYPELGELLTAECQELETDPEVCALYRLRPEAPEISKVVSPGHDRQVGGVAGSIAALVEALLPLDSSLLVVTLGDDRLLGLPRAAIPFPGSAPLDPLEDRGAGSRIVAELEWQRQQGADFLVVPRTSYWWLEQCSALREHLASSARLVAVRGQTCAIFELRRTEEGRR